MTNHPSRSRKQTLQQALRLERAGKLKIAECGLAGCPTGGWAETQQAMRRIADELPRADERSYSLHDLISSLYSVDHAGRYVYRAAP